MHAPCPPASARLQAHGLSAVLPDGRTLYSDVALSPIDGAHVLVGRNGGGKSTLLHQLAGLPTDVTTTGLVHVAGRVHLLAQPDPDAARASGNVATLLGVDTALDALARLLAGNGDAADFALLDDRWDLATRVEAALADAGFAELPTSTASATLSAGERQRLRLLGACLADADVLLLDEPTTFLDARASADWCARMHARRGVTLAVTHDPSWLRAVPHLYALDDGLLRAFDGVEAWRSTIATEHASQARALADAHVARTRARRDAATERERLDRRAARGRRTHAEANQSPLLLDRLRDRADRSQGRSRDGIAARVSSADAAVRTAFEAHDGTPSPVFVAAEVALPAGRRVVSFDDAHPLAVAPSATLSAHYTGPVRIGLEGGNGSGKTTLLRAIAGEATLAHGRVDAHVRVRRLDASLLAMPAETAALDWLRACMDSADTADVATRLALVGLRGTRARQPLGTLSGGERMRVAVAAAAWSRPAAPLLLLDEPASHLDADSTHALVDLLRAWPGALMVVSHDAAMLDRLTLDMRLRLDGDGLRAGAGR